MSTAKKNHRILSLNTVRRSSRGKLFDFRAILRQKCQEQMRERRNELFNKSRAGLLPTENVQETLTEIVRREFDKLATVDKPNVVCTATAIINGPLSQDEALREEREIITEQEQWLMQEYERLMRCEEKTLYDPYDDEVICPMCKKSFLEEIPDFIVCYACGLKIKSEISLTKFKYDLETFVNNHSENCSQVPDFSLIFDKNDTSLCISCLLCSVHYLIKTAESH